MKQNTFKIFWVLPFLLLIWGCTGTIESFQFDSPDGDRHVEISGEAGTIGDPIMVTVKLTVPAGSKSFKFEHQSTSLTKENVSAEWFNNNRCTLTFMLDDGTSWQVECFLLDDRIEAVKRFTIDGKELFHH